MAFEKFIESFRPHTGRYLKENDNTVNIADIAERIGRTLNGINSVQVSESYPVISLKSNYGLSSLRDVVTVTGTGNVTNVIGDGYYSVFTGTTAGSTATLDSVERGRYVSGSVANPGVGVRIPTLPTGDAVARWGYFNDDTGLGFGVDSSGVFIFRRFNGVDDIVRQADWDDPLDGTGPSGASFDLNDYNIFATPFRWYGSGPAIFEVSGSNTGTDTIFAHQLKAENELIVSDPNLQLRIEVDNGTTEQNLEVRVGGRQFSILGRYQPNRRITSERRLLQSIGTTFVPIISFKQKPAFDSVSVKTSGFSVLASNAPLLMQVRIDPLLTGAVFAAPQDSLASETALDFDYQATAISGGLCIYQDVQAAGAGTNIIGGEQDVPEFDLPVNVNVTLCARSISGTATVSTVFRAKEEW